MQQLSTYFIRSRYCTDFEKCAGEYNNLNCFDFQSVAKNVISCKLNYEKIKLFDRGMLYP